MNKNETIIRTRGYEVTLPTAAVAGFLALSHDDQCDMADQFNSWDADRNQYDFADIDETEDFGTADLIGDLIEEMAQDLDAQDQAIDEFMIEREQLLRKLDERRDENHALVDDCNGLFNRAQEFEAQIDNLNDVLFQSARYVGQARELLSHLGITVATDVEDGQPFLDITYSQLASFVASTAAIPA